MSLPFFMSFVSPTQLLPSFEISAWDEDDVVSLILLMPHGSWTEAGRAVHMLGSAVRELTSRD